VKKWKVIAIIDCDHLKIGRRSLLTCTVALGFPIALGARTRGAEQVRMVENPPAFDSARRRGVGSRHLKLAMCQFFTNCTRHRITQARSQNKPEHNARRREVPVQMQVNTRIHFNVSKGML